MPTKRTLSDNEKRQRIIFNSALDAIITIDASGIVVAFNPAAEKIFGFRSEEICGQELVKTIIPPSLRRKHRAGFRRYLKTGKHNILEQRIDIIAIHANGEEFPVELTITPYTIGGDQFFTGFLRDITERKQAEENLLKVRDELETRVEKRTRELTDEIAKRKQTEDKIKASLAEKEILLQEIHHRVKNNLQVISSMLSLQAGTETDNRSIQVLKESIRRVRVMARIHEKLYQSDDLAYINARDYLYTIVEDTKASSRNNAKDISFHLEVDDIIFDIDNAVPCGQIISEILSNSLKHAFPNGQSGNIEVSLHRKYGGKIELTIVDDGKGLPDGFDPQQTETLGMKLVHALVMQLRGVIDVDGSGGTRIRITFPERPL